VVRVQHLPLFDEVRRGDEGARVAARTRKEPVRFVLCQACPSLVAFLALYSSNSTVLFLTVGVSVDLFLVRGVLRKKEIGRMKQMCKSTTMNDFIQAIRWA
jgi:hypothetical protein